MGTSLRRISASFLSIFSVTNLNSTLNGQICRVGLFLFFAVTIFNSLVVAQVYSNFTSVFSQNQKGNIVFVGNALMTCPSGGNCSKAQGGASDQNNNYSMIQIDVDGDGTTINSSTADFTLPSGGSVLWAGLYWGAVSSSSSRNQVKFATPVAGYTTITGTVGATSYGYQGFADVTTRVQQGGAGTYKVGNVQANTGTNKWAGWTLVIVVQDPSQKLRNLNVYNGLALVSQSNQSVTISISGFKTPLSGPVNTQLGIVAYDGDKGYTGDKLKLNSTDVTNTINTNTDFFNSSISYLNAFVTSKNPNYVNQLGFDADVVDASNIIPNGATSATLTLTTSGESYIPGCVTSAIELFAPDIQTTKIGYDVNLGLLEPGDTLEYTLVAKNVGQDGARDVILRDTIPANSTYIPGSLQITNGANVGSKSDATGDDQAEYNSGNNLILFRLGAGANGSQGGTLALSESTTVKFKIQIDPLAADQARVRNQGSVAFTSQTLLTPYEVQTFAADTVVVWAADLRVTKTANPTSIQGGQNTVFTIKVVNFGKKNTTGVTVADTLPAGLNFVSSSATLGTYSSSTGIWTVGSFGVGDSAILTITATGTSGGIKTNTALTKASSRPDPYPTNNSSSVSVTVSDTSAPAAPVITFPLNGSSTNDNTPTITGTAEAFSKVRVYIDGVLKDSVTANASGNWSYTSAALAQGNHTVRATATDGSGNTSPSSPTNTFSIDTGVPAKPVITVPSNGQTFTTSTPTWTGTSEANVKIRLYVNGVLFDSTYANGSGNWSYLCKGLANGSYTLRVRAVDAAGNVSEQSSSKDFTISDSTAPSAPIVQTPANGSTITTTTPVISGTSEPYNKIRIYVDGVLKDSVTANASGNWTYTSTALSQGSHNVKAKAVDPAGNTSGYSNINTFTVDSVAPNAPVVVLPANGSTVTTSRPVFTGTAEANSKVRIYVDGVLTDSTTTNGSGNWSDTSNATLSDGSHNVKAVVVDAAGNVSGFSNTNTFTIDATAPSAPVVVTPANGSTTSTTPTFSGTAEANSKVRLYVDGVLVDSTTANGSGAWSKLSAALAQGSHTIKATATDAAGHTSVFSNTNTFTIDTVAPNAPVVSTPANGSYVTTTTPLFTGTAEANSKIRMYVDGVLVDSTTANGSGAWSDTSAALAQGSHTIKVTATDAAGNTSVFSNTNTFTVDSITPNAPVVTAPTNGSYVTTTTPLFTGTAEANSKVRIYVDGVLVDSTTANGSGAWSDTSAALAQGSHTIKVTSTDAAGNTSVFSNVNTFTIDTVAPNAPIVAAPANGSTVATTTPTFTGTAEANSKVRLYVDGVLVDSTTTNGSGAWSKISAALAQGSHTIKVTATDAAGNTSVFSNINTFTVDSVAPNAPVVTAPANGSTVNTTTPTFTGTAEADSKVRLYVDGVLVDSTTANGSGAWSKVSAALTQGSHTIKATSVDAAGNVSSFSNTNTFTVDPVAPNAPVVTAPANGSTVATTTPTFTGTAEANSKVRLYVDGVLVDSTTANGSGAWSKASAALAQGSHTIKATSVDAAGNVSGFSNTNTFTVDTVAPNAPVVVAPANGSTVNTTTPTFSGTAEANSKVRLYVDGVLVDSTTTNGSGAWSKVSATLAQGSHTIKATSVDVAGNVSSFSNTNTFTVDSVAPNAPVVVLPANGSTVTTTTPTFTGTAEANSKVHLYVDGVLVDSTTADGSGNFSKVSAVLAQGSHTIKATSTDAVGNTSGFSNTNTFTIDMVAPNAPVVILPADGSIVATTTPTFTGTAEVNSKVRLYVDGVLVDSTTADGSGNFSKVSAALAQGSHTIKATSTDAAGNTSGFSNTNTFTIDTVAPNVPIVILPADGSIVTTTTPTFTGTAEANSKVRLYVDGVLVDSTTADGSGNFSKVSAALAQGSHTIKATSTDAAGNTSGLSNTNTFTIDTVAPNAPVVILPADGSIVATTTPTFTGTAEANSKVRLYVDGVLVDSTTADGSGNFSKVSATLSQGSHTIKATSTDAAGNTSGFSNTNTFTIDTIAPNAPTVATPANGSIISTSTPTFSGTAEANSKVRLYVDGVLVDSTTANGSGNYSALSATLIQGSHTIKVTSTDAAGNTSVFSNTNTFTINTGVPTVPVIASPVDNSSTPDNTPLISGTADPNDTVKIYVDGVLVATVVTDGSGDWTYTSSPLADGPHTIHATATNNAGTTSGNSPTTDFTVDTVAPNAPVVILPADGSLITTTTPTFTGTAEANSKVRLYVDGVLVDSTTADGSGNFSKVSAALAQGNHTIKATSTDAAGNTSGFSNTNTFTIDTIAPNAPVVILPADGSIITTTTPTFTGTAEANSKVRLYVDGVLVDSTTADGSGNFSKVSAALAQGSHTTKATSTDAAGNTSGFSNTNTFTIDTVAPNAPVVILPADGSIITTTTPTFTGTAEANSKVRLYVDGVLVDSTTADGSGNFSKVSASLAQGSHTIKATSTDAAGNTSGFSSTNTFTIDTIAPNAPVVILPADGSVIATTTPTFTGTAEANSKVRLYVDGVLVDSTTADGSGNFSNVSATLAQGSHTIKATSTDAAGNTSGFSNTNTFTIDTVAPNAPVVILPTDGSTVTTTTPTFTGTAEANSKVRLYVDGVLVDSTTADGSGNFSKVSATLAQGSHTIKATSTDAAGNTSGFSNTNTFFIDTQVPNAPVVLSPADGSTITTTTPTFIGTAEANSKVRLYVDGILVDSVTADGSGNFNKVSAPLSQGSHTITVTSTDAIGNTSGFSNTNTFTIDTVAPNAPVVILPADGSTVTTTTPTFTGTAEPNSKVRLYVDGVLVDSTTANGSGNFSKVSAPLAQGSHTIKATSTDAAGNTSVFSNTNTFILNTVPPPVAIITPANASVINDNTPTINGTTDPNLPVIISMDGVPFDTVTSDGSGNWTTTYSTPLIDGPHTVTALATAVNGLTATTSNLFTIDTISPTVVITNPALTYLSNPVLSGIAGTAETFSRLIISIDGVPVDTIQMGSSPNWTSDYTGTLPEGPHTITVVATDPAGNTNSTSKPIVIDTIPPSITVSTPADNSVTNDNTPPISGLAEPNTFVIVYVDGVPIDSMIAVGGVWSTNRCPVLSDGPHTVSATGRDAANNQNTSAENNFTVDANAPSVAITTPVNGSTTSNTQPPINGTSEPGCTVVLSLDGVPVDTFSIPVNGLWNYDPPSPLAEGPHTAIAVATDATGNTATATSNFTIDTTLPYVTIILPADGSILTTLTPTLTGTAEPATTARVYVDGNLVTTFTQNGSGNWSHPSAALTVGTHTAFATATDGAGNMATSVTHTFSIDNSLPTVSVVTPADGSTINTNTPTLSGTSEPNALTKVYLDSVLDTTFTQDATGTWSYPSEVLSEGFHQLFASATDSAGNTALSDTNIFRILTTPVLTAISPSTKRVGYPAFTMIVSGENFRPTSVVRFNGSDRPTTYVSPTQLLVDVPESDLANVGSKNVSVFTPAPGGGISNSLPFTVTGATISGIVFYDVNRNGVRDPNEVGIGGIRMNATATNPSNSQLTTTQPNGTYLFTNVPLDDYSITESLPSGWATKTPVTGNYDVNISIGSDLFGYDFANYVFSDTGSYRTFTPMDLITKKAVSRKKCNGFTFSFNFPNKTGRKANGLYVEFNNVVTQFTTFSPFEEMIDLGQNAQDYKFYGPIIDTGQVIVISGFSAVTPCRIRIEKWWWLWNDTNTSKKRSEGPMWASFFASTLPMPNNANVRDEVMSNGQIISYGLQVGVPSIENSRKYAWVDVRKSTDFQGSLIDKIGMATGSPRGFTNGPRAGAIVGKQKKLPPSKFNNRLFAELLALKFNIWASNVNMTPNGFGELIFQENNNPLSGMMIKDIGKRADTLMTFWKDFADSSLYINMDTTVRKLNLAFYGPLDTNSFALKTRAKGVRSITDIDFLRANPKATPSTQIEEPVLSELDNLLPQQFELHQNYPDPFNPSTTISFELPTVSVVTLKVYDVLGKEVATPINQEEMDAGNQTVEFDGSNLASGVYFYKIVATVPLDNDDDILSGQSFVNTKKMMLLR